MCAVDGGANVVAVKRDGAEYPALGENLGLKAKSGMASLEMSHIGRSMLSQLTSM